MDRLSRYKQILSLITYTAVAILAVFGVLWVSLFFYENFAPVQQPPKKGVLSHRIADSLASQNMRQQIISYDAPQIIDSVLNIYLIPVGVKDLDKPEEVRKWSSREPSHFEGGSPEGYDGNSGNNLLVYFLNSEELIPIFHSRISLNQFHIRKITKKPLLFIQATNEDSNKDGLLNESDLEHFYVYSFQERRLNEIKLTGATFITFDVMNNNHDLMIRFGLDRNKDGEYDYEKEPDVLYKYSLEDQKLQSLVDPKLSEKLQSLLEGRKENQ